MCDEGPRCVCVQARIDGGDRARGWGDAARAGLTVDCVDAGEVGDVESYDAVVLGSAVYMKRWRGDAKHFLRKHGKELSQRPFWVFSSGPIGDPSGDKPSWEEPPRIVERAEALGVREHVIFGGRVPTDPHGPAQRAMVENTPPSTATGATGTRSADGHRASLPSSAQQCPNT